MDGELVAGLDDLRLVDVLRGFDVGVRRVSEDFRRPFARAEELRAQIKGSGIGTSATRAEILKKLVNIEYLALNKKTQVLTPTQMGEMIYDVVSDSIRPLLNPALTASWEKGLTMVADGVITPDDYMGKLTDFVGRRTVAVRGLNNQGVLWRQFQATEEFYQKKQKQSNAKNKE